MNSEENIMKHEVNEKTLTIYLEGEINSSNSEQVEKDVEKVMAESTFDKVVLDFENVRYISSAGLRIIVRIKQQYDDTSLVKVPKGVYDILEMVGFNNLMTIEKL